MTRPTNLAGRLLALLVLGVVAAGCTSSQSSCPRGCPLEPPHPLPPETARGSMADRILSEPAPAMPATFVSLRKVSLPYRAYSPLDCQCDAVAHAPLADSLDKERARIAQEGQQSGRKCRRDAQSASRQRSLRQMILFYTALEIRNDCAGLALQWYFQLAGHEAKTDLTEAGKDEVFKGLREVDTLQQRGLHVPVEIEKVRRQMIELQEEQASALLEVEHTNERLHQLLAHGCNPAWRMWPEPLPPGESIPIPDVESAVAVALAERPYLLLLRCLIQELDRDTLPVVQDMMHSVGGLLSRQEAAPHGKHLTELAGLFKGHDSDDASLQTIHSQLCTLLHRQEARVASEVRQAIAGMQGYQEMTLLARQRVERWNVELRKMDERVSHGLLSSLELVNPRLDRLRAQGDACKDWLSVLGYAGKLRQAQGLLVKECSGACGAPGGCPPRDVPHQNGPVLADLPAAH